MSTQYKILVGDTATPQSRIPKTGSQTYLAPVSLTDAAGNEVAFDIQYIVNKATSGNDTGLVINLTDTLSPGNSLLQDWQVGATSLAAIDNVGQLTLDKNLTYGNTTGIAFGDGDTIIYEIADDQLSIVAGGVEGIRVTNASQQITIDLDAGDNAAGNVGALTSIKSAIATITSSAATTLTAASLIPAGCFLLGLTARITTGFGTTTGLTDFDVGDGSDVDRWANSLAITSGITLDLTNATAAANGSFAAANDVVLTAVGGNFDSTGVIELLVHFITLTAPTG